ncbi:hypothetical protein [Virgibacillus sp. AGTR]|uniref:hypothetical protein n=1 Tax=Virgibacillus sp. AGTR TaxID=2812055 RepID=UPI0027E10970|nr:hypothetical protein [Virgibacillus sp. AGTR]
MRQVTGATSTTGVSERSPRKPTKRKELKQAKRVRKQEKARKDNQEKNRARVRKGKKIKADPGTEFKPSIWERFAEDKLYHQLREMGDTTKNIDKFQRKRALFSLFIVLIGCVTGAFVHVWLYLTGPIFGVVFYKMQAKKVDRFYKAWKFQRQLNFSKFTRLVIPYLKRRTTALYTIFNKILQRTDDEADKRSLYQLMGEMGDNPESLDPFTDFAERSSGTDMSHLFMSTIYDFQHSTFDVSVIDELGRMASEDMMNAIDEIIEMKLRRFVMFPTKVVMSSFILVAGLGVGLMIDNFKDLDFNGGVMNPSAQIQSAEQIKENAVDGDTPSQLEESKPSNQEDDKEAASDDSD